ncbi:pyridoxal-phosphate dependent enzyme [Chloroflexota bacterium]
MTSYCCVGCFRGYPQEMVYRCPNCGDVFDLAGEISYFPEQVMPKMPGVWKYHHTFGMPLGAPIFTLGEGNTPLVLARSFGRDIYFKLENLNPTGSFKDRLTAVQISNLVAYGVEEAVEDSSGNAGASFAAYAARAGIKGRVYVPSSASGTKRAQIEMYGAEIIEVPGPRSAAAKAVIEAVENEGMVYASHAYLPFGLPGIATIAYEVFEQLGQLPKAVIAPLGHGSLLLGIANGFLALRHSGIVEDVPKIIGVQAKACAPIWAQWKFGKAGLDEVVEGETLAKGIRVRGPIRGEALLKLARECAIRFAAVEEDAILTGRDQLARLGFYVETTSAVVWDAIHQVIEDFDDPVVVILSGSGLKNEHP